MNYSMYTNYDEQLLTIEFTKNIYVPLSHILVDCNKKRCYDLYWENLSETAVNNRNEIKKTTKWNITSIEENV